MLRPRVRQGPRPRPAVHPPPRPRHHRLRRPVRQGRQADRLRSGRYRARRQLRRRGFRRHAARASGAASAIRRGKRSAPHLPRHRNAGPPGHLADGAHRHPDRRRDLSPPEPRNRPEDHGARSARPTNSPASPSTSLHRSSSPRSCSTKLGLPVKKKTASGGPFDRRGSALRTGARLPAAQAAARTRQPGQAQGHLHRQAAEHDQPGDRPRAYHFSQASR